MQNKLFERLVLNERQEEEFKQFVFDFDLMENIDIEKLLKYIKNHDAYDAFINRSNDQILSYMSVHENRLEKLNERIKDFPEDVQEFLRIALYLRTVMRYVLRDSIYLLSKYYKPKPKPEYFETITTTELYNKYNKPQPIYDEISNILCGLIDELFKLESVKTKVKDHLDRYGD